MYSNSVHYCTYIIHAVIIYDKRDIFQFPNLQARVSNTTISTANMMSDISFGFVVIPFIGFLEDIAIAQAFARRNNYNVDASQELIALGVANFLGSFLSAYPITGSFSRTTVNAISGVATPFGGNATKKGKKV